MNDKNENEKKTGKKAYRPPLVGKSLYVAIGLCLLAAGLASRAASRAGVRVPNAADSQSQTNTAERSTLPDLFADLPTASPTVEAVPEAETETRPPQPVFENNAPAAETTTAAPAEIRFSAPLSNGIGDDYSMGVPVFSDTMGDYRTHNGVDFTGDVGENVCAIAPGTVTAVTDDRMFGNCVTVDHGNGVVSTVCGLGDEGLIREGAAVSEDTVLGVVGTVPAEEKEAPHIHLEVRKDGELCDPLALLGLDGTED